MTANLLVMLAIAWPFIAVLGALLLAPVMRDDDEPDLFVPADWCDR